MKTPGAPGRAGLREQLDSTHQPCNFATLFRKASTE